MALLNLFLGFIGWLFGWIAMALWELVKWLLNATIFNVTSITPGSPGISGVIGGALVTVWYIMLAISAAVALVMLVWGAFRLHLGALSGGKFDKSVMLEGFVTWAAIVVGGQVMLFTLLSVANMATKAVVGFAGSSMLSGLALNFTSGAAAGGVTAGVVSILVYLFFPVAMLYLVGALFWAVVVWVMRQVELVFYCSMLPLTASLAIGGNKQAFDWNWREAVGVIFSQLAMAIAFLIASLIFSGGGPIADPLSASSSASSATQFAPTFFRILVGGFAFSMVSKAPNLLKGITGHQSAGLGTIMGGVAAGSLLAKGVQSASRASLGGAAMHAINESKQAQALNKVSGFGEEDSTGYFGGAQPRGGMPPSGSPNTGLDGPNTGSDGFAQAALARAGVSGEGAAAGAVVASGGNRGLSGAGRLAHTLMTPRAALGAAVRGSMGRGARARASVVERQDRAASDPYLLATTGQGFQRGVKGTLETTGRVLSESGYQDAGGLLPVGAAGAGLSRLAGHIKEPSVDPGWSAYARYKQGAGSVAVRTVAAEPRGDGPKNQPPRRPALRA